MSKEQFERANRITLRVGLLAGVALVVAQIVL